MHDRILLCASAAHCAQVLQAAAADRVKLHSLQPSTRWPSPAPDTHPLILWALLPTACDAAALALEAQWRAHMLQPQAQHFTIQMLYGSAAQQARQLVPWIKAETTDAGSATDADCPECLDARSEQSLFQHLLQRSQTTQQT